VVQLAKDKLNSTAESSFARSRSAKNPKSLFKMRQTALKHAKQAETGWWLSVSKYRDEQ